MQWSDWNSVPAMVMLTARNLRVFNPTSCPAPLVITPRVSNEQCRRFSVRQGGEIPKVPEQVDDGIRGSVVAEITSDDNLS